MLIYPIQFEADPPKGIQRVLDQVVMRRGDDFTAADFLNAIQTALASDTKLSELIPQDHSETTIRAYLAELGRSLETLLGQGPTA